MNSETNNTFSEPVENIDAPVRQTRKKRKSHNARSDDVGEAQPKKRARWQARAGKLSLLLNVPLDVLFEIFSHLLPLDILHLARTTKDFRRLLMHKSSLSVWKTARGNVHGFPDCPPYLTEPEYANLAFSPHCHVCLASTTVRTVEWTFRVRLCTACSKNHIIDFLYTPPGEEPCWEDMIPTRPGKRCGEFTFDREALQVEQHYESLLTPESRRTYIQERQLLLSQIQAHVPLCERWMLSMAQDKSKEREEARNSRRAAILEKLTELGWADEIERIPYQDSLDNHKLVKQPTRLTERIWSNIRPAMIEYMTEMRTKRIARERKALILKRKTAAILILQEYKMQHLPQKEPLPESADFCEFQKVREVLELPSDVKIGRHHFARVLEIMPSLIEQWRKRVDRELVKVVKGEKADNSEETNIMFDTFIHTGPQYPLTDDEAEARLTLATTVFKCSLCCPQFGIWCDHDEDMCHPAGNPLFYPRVIGHRCNTKLELDYLYLPGELSSYDVDDPSKVLRTAGRFRRTWSSKYLRIDTQAATIVERIVLACGLDPKVTSAEDMDVFDGRLGCFDCVERTGDSGDSGEIEIFEWRDAVKHEIQTHDQNDVKWRLLSPLELETAHMVEVAGSDTETVQSGDGEFVLEGNNSQPQDPSVWACARCHDTPMEPSLMTLENVKDHIVLKHVQDPKVNGDYFEDYAAPEIYSHAATHSILQFVSTTKY